MSLTNYPGQLCGTKSRRLERLRRNIKLLLTSEMFENRQFCHLDSTDVSAMNKSKITDGRCYVLFVLLQRTYVILKRIYSTCMTKFISQFSFCCCNNLQNLEL